MQAEQTFETVRSALARALSPLVAWIPDVTTIPRQRQIALAAIASVLFHLVIVACLVVHELVWPVHNEPPPPASPAPLQVTIVQKPQPLPPDDPLTKEQMDFLNA